ncbi:hypothetical protein PDM28_07700 [Stenotrophomonas aracearum]|jgi:flagellar biosynthesis component FlhA|uniref:Transmembrane protein n=1 Tax=Stenotrophomonas aracearum TaxID=3003272 RepID=A0ABY9YH23_9GAMM|nr:hypothetical protein [Stenotrophomonas sp. A5588]WNH50162.1 hypothetical protein PDM28_07700 [Stenotrophomonas sp. A5588]
MQRKCWEPPRAAREERHAGTAGLSASVIVLLVVAALTVSLGFAWLPDSLLGIGVVGVGLFLAISARICQAREQHQALCRVLEHLRSAPRY